MMDHLELEGDHRPGDWLKILGYGLGLLICHFAAGLCAERSESGALRFIVFVVTTTMMMRAGWLLGRDTGPLQAQHRTASARRASIEHADDADQGRGEAGMTVSYDDYREVVNSDATYDEVARVLQTGQPVILGWTDQLGTHFDILFSWDAKQFGSLQGGLRAGTDLFVTIMRWGAFGFSVPMDAESHPNYIGGKLGLEGETAEAVAALVNGVRERLGAKSPATHLPHDNSHHDEGKKPGGQPDQHDAHDV